MPNFQESTTILSARTKKVWKPIEGPTYLRKFKKHIGRKATIESTKTREIA